MFARVIKTLQYERTDVLEGNIFISQINQISA